MDNLDKELILQLSANGRKNYIEIARDLGVSERTVRNRINALIEDGTIKISAIPDLDALGFHFVGILAVQVQLPLLAETARKLKNNKHIVLLMRVTGRYDLIAFIATRTLKEYGEVMDNIFLECPGIVRTETFSRISSSKGEIGDLAVDQLIADMRFPSARKYRQQD